MVVSVEISYYPLTEDFNTPIDSFIEQISESPRVTVEAGKMSTLITGDYGDVMNLLSNTMGDLMSRYPSVFNLKISNSCPV